MHSRVVAMNAESVVMSSSRTDWPPAVNGYLPAVAESIDTTWLDATAQADLVRSGEAGPEELVDEAIARVEALNPQLDAVIRARFDEAREEAREAVPDGPFRGVPFLLKDLGAVVAGEPTAAGIGPMASAAMPVSSFLAEHFRAAGFVVLGRTNVPEFGTTFTTEPKSFRPPATRGTASTQRGDHPADRRPRWRAAWFPRLTATTGAARSASRPASPGSSGSSRRGRASAKAR